MLQTALWASIEYEIRILELNIFQFSQHHEPDQSIPSIEKNTNNPSFDVTMTFQWRRSHEKLYCWGFRWK